MPQHSMFPTDPRLRGIRLAIVDRTPDLVDGFDFTVELRHDDLPWSTLHSARYTGVMVDLLSGGAEDVVGSFLYGEGGRDILRASFTNLRVAKAHRKRYEG